MSEIVVSLHMPTDIRTVCASAGEARFGATTMIHVCPIPGSGCELFLTATDGRHLAVVKAECEVLPEDPVFMPPSVAVPETWVSLNDEWRSDNSRDAAGRPQYRKANKQTVCPRVQDAGRFPNMPGVMPELKPNYTLIHLDPDYLVSLVKALNGKDPEHNGIYLFLPPTITQPFSPDDAAAIRGKFTDDADLAESILAGGIDTHYHKTAAIIVVGKHGAGMMVPLDLEGSNSDYLALWHKQAAKYNALRDEYIAAFRPVPDGRTPESVPTPAPAPQLAAGTGPEDDDEDGDDDDSPEMIDPRTDPDVEVVP